MFTMYNILGSASRVRSETGLIRGSRGLHARPVVCRMVRMQSSTNLNRVINLRGCTALYSEL